MDINILPNFPYFTELGTASPGCVRAQLFSSLLISASCHLASRLFMLEILTISNQCRALFLAMKAIKKQNQLLKDEESWLNLEAKIAIDRFHKKENSYLRATV